ncbi:MAG: GNAT family N-acetyltransferase [Duncaniella sp.]|uniref:GNAT family N-acetyltransferase n=1 Tax=Duncaniella sp. TaxID=2518496 RepID=UPI0023D72F9B|nr:GNAT family N-acetyltransferase [Duncaniella sp.]MDE6089903.1 GNAT family N-acetyltransferase [Duncaniella sp.]
MNKIVKCQKSDYAILAGIWERSVRATHDFLTENDIESIRQALIPDYFPNVDIYGLSVGGSIVGFIGLSGNKIEMLFIDADKMGLGYGSALMAFAMNRGATSVDVNEQNPTALEFYKSKGFKIIRRDETDEAGRPFPILHLSR